MRLFTIIFLSLCLVSCGNQGAKMDRFKEVASMEMEAAPIIEKTIASQSSKKVVKNGKIDFQSENITEDYLKVKSLIANYDSYIDYENQSNNDYRSNYDITIRVNSKNYDSLFLQLSKISSRVDFKSSNTEDVTEQYYDLKTRIKNKKALEEKYLLLLNRASTIKDILDIERNLNDIRNEIESAEGSFRYLSKQVLYSTIQLNFYQIAPAYTETENFWSRITTAMGRGWRGFISFFVGLVQAWPYLILGTIGVIAFSRIRKNRASKK